MKRQIIKVIIVILTSFLFVELFKIIFTNSIENYFFDRNSKDSEAMTLTILSIRELPFLLFAIFTFIFRKKIKVKWYLLLLGIFLGYLLNRIIW